LQAARPALGQTLQLNLKNTPVWNSGQAGGRSENYLSASLAEWIQGAQESSGRRTSDVGRGDRKLSNDQAGPIVSRTVEKM
jgi:hypothetical protein